MSDIVNKLWGFCHTLRHDGIDYGDYLEQITYLLFLKMADERDIDLSSLRVNPKGKSQKTIDCSWSKLSSLSGTDLTEHYANALRVLGKQGGLLSDIFMGSQSRFNNSVNLRKLISLIDETQWTKLGIDVKGEAFEGLLQRAANEGKKGAGQYFTPRVLIESIVHCMRPDPRAHDEFTLTDPACGTGGFLVVAYEWFIKETGGALDRKLYQRIKQRTYYGQELVLRPRRLALMNLYLHDLEPTIKLGDTIYEPKDSRQYDVCLTNPPFGTKGANQIPIRDDFTIATTNKQLNFIQHVMSILKPGGRAAVVVPDNCLFADQAGEVFEILTENFDLHTVLRLPNGTFTPYAAGVKTNVIFFTKGQPTQTTWIYDARTNVPRVTKKARPLTQAHFTEFEICYGDDPNGRARRSEGDSAEDRWRAFDIKQIEELGYKLDSLRWLKDDSLDDPDSLPDPEDLASDALTELESAIDEINMILAILENGNGTVPPEVAEQEPSFSSAV